MKIVLTCSVIVVFAAISASAAPILYTFKGTASGNVGATSFTDRQFRIDLVGNTTHVSLAYDGLTYTTGRNLSAVIHIDGVGDGLFMQQIQIFDSYQIPSLGMSDDVHDLLEVMSPEVVTYRLNSPLGPVTDKASSPYSNFYQQPLDIGLMTITDVSGITFTATLVPEPCTMAIAATGLSLLLHTCRRLTR